MRIWAIGQWTVSFFECSLFFSVEGPRFWVKDTDKPEHGEINPT
jgi:hypothetical protein